MSRGTWCIAGRATDEALTYAGDLLAAGEQVAIIAPDVARCALLVSEYGESILTVQTDSSDIESASGAADAVAEAFGEVDGIWVVPTIGGPLRVDVTALLLRWPEASIAPLGHVAQSARVTTAWQAGGPGLQ
jgi:NAD(P)-dependent dehydrogenase (short-subunit alcohol dehydrogenase family)